MYDVLNNLLKIRELFGNVIPLFACKNDPQNQTSTICEALFSILVLDYNDYEYSLNRPPNAHQYETEVLIQRTSAMHDNCT